MDIQEALLLVGAKESETWKEDLIFKVFEIKQFILKTYHPPQVCWSRAQKIHQLAVAEAFLEQTELKEKDVSEKVYFLEKKSTIQDLIAAYRHFENQISTLKLQFLQSDILAETSRLLKKMGDLEHQKLNDLAELALQLNMEETTFKISAYINSGEIIRELIPFEKEPLINLLQLPLPNFSTELAKSLNYINFTKK